MSNNLSKSGNVPQRKKASKKPLIIIGVVAAVVVCWLIAAAVLGPGMRRQELEKFRAQLQQDSTELAGITDPSYDNPTDVFNAYVKLRELGKPGRYSALATETDSIRMLSDPAIKALVEHNIAACDSITSATGPQWRQAYAQALSKKMGDGLFAYGMSGEKSDSPRLSSPDFPQMVAMGIVNRVVLDDDALQDVCEPMSYECKHMGYAEVQFGVSPESEYIYYNP